MKIIVILITLAATIITGFWAALAPGWDSISALCTSIAALASTFFLPGKTTSATQNQTIGDSSNGIQAGRDVNIN